MKLTHKKPQNPQAESKSGTTGESRAEFQAGVKAGILTLQKRKKSTT